MSDEQKGYAIGGVPSIHRTARSVQPVANSRRANQIEHRQKGVKKLTNIPRDGIQVSLAGAGWCGVSARREKLRVAADNSPGRINNSWHENF